MNIPNKFFLTPKQKVKDMAQLKRILKQGNIDKKMIPYLDQVNALPGFMTQFCCEGHTGDKINKETGNLIVKISAGVFNNVFIKGNFPTLGYGLHGTLTIDFYGGECRIVFAFNRKMREKYLDEMLNHIKSLLPGGSKYVGKKVNGNTKKSTKGNEQV